MTCFYCNKGHLTDDGRRTCGRLNHVDRAGGGQFIAKYVSDTHKCKQFEWKYISWGEIPGPIPPRTKKCVDKRHSITIL